MSERIIYDPIEDILNALSRRVEEIPVVPVIPLPEIPILEEDVKIMGQESKGKTKRKDSKINLEKLYWQERKSETMIMYEIDYSTPQEVVDKLIKWGIPTRAPDRAKVKHEFIHQADDTTQLRAIIFTADGDEIISENFSVEQFRQFNILLSLSKEGTPTGAYIQVFVEFSFDEVVWFPLRDYPWNKAYETNNSIDATVGVLWSRSGICPADFIRIRFVATGANLSATAFFTVDQVHVALF